MGRFIKGDVVVLPFPFSNLSGSKKRPALVVAQLGGDDVILCMITKTDREDGYSIPLSGKDFDKGALSHDSNIRPNRLFTADSNIINYCAGRLSSKKVSEVTKRIIDILSN
jgi:mRNA interferase MazF